MKIQALELFSPNLEKQTTFYSQVLGLDILEKSSTAVAFQIGDSILKLSYREKTTPYHYAINIPANQEKEALAWLKKRLTILTYAGLEIQYFDFWDAYAIYFYDEDQNIGELIARKTLKNDSKEVFSKDSMLEISEIGIPTDDINREYNILKKATDMPIHSGNLERFCAIGDGQGLFIAINKTFKKEWFPTKDKPFSSDFNIRFVEKGKEYLFTYEKEKLKEVHSPIQKETLLKGYIGEDGKFTQMPGKRQKKKVAAMLEVLAAQFEEGKKYTEREVNEILNQHHSFNDPATLRRLLFGSKLINRTLDGKAYWLNIKE